jgi:divalent metal cation (Fe/Co/Zn/Cd) transporter
VFYEDSAGVAGVLIATAGVALHQLTGSAVPDALASVAVGALLVFVAVRLARRDRELLTNQSAPRPIVDGVRAVPRDGPGVVGVPRLEVLVVGPRTWLITAEVALDGSLPGDAVTRRIGELRARLAGQSGVAGVYLSPVPAEARRREG